MDFEEKRKGIGGSDVAALFDEDPFKSKHDIYRRIKYGDPGPPSTVPQMVGKALEPFLAAEYMKRTGRQIERHDRTIPAPNHPGIFITPDALAVDGSSVIEFKATSGFEVVRAGTADELPVHWQLQGQLYCETLDIPQCVFVVLWGFEAVDIYLLPRDYEVGQIIVGRISEFMHRYIEGDEEPPLVPTEATREWIRWKYPVHRTKPRPATLDEAALLDQYAQIREEASYIADEKERLELIIKDRIGDAEGITWDRGRFLWRKTKDSTKVDWKTLAGSLMRNYSQSDRIRLETEFSRIQEGVRRMDFRLYSEKRLAHAG